MTDVSYQNFSYNFLIECSNLDGSVRTGRKIKENVFISQTFFPHDCVFSAGFILTLTVMSRKKRRIDDAWDVKG